MGRESISSRLLKKLRDELPQLEIPEGAQLARNPSARAEAHRKNGAWSWYMTDSSGIPISRDSTGALMAIGSHWPMEFLLKYGVEAHPGLYGDICIDPPIEAQSCETRRKKKTP